MAVIANIFYGFPSKKLHVIGVTGTDGKTTTVNMVASILRAGGRKTAHLSTVNAEIGEKVYDTGLHTTTPSSFLLQRFLARAAGTGAEYFVLEVTSHALDQFRTWGIRFETAVLTNVSHEHLDYHKDLETYRAVKAKLFDGVKYAVLNGDDPGFDLFKARTTAAQVVYGFDPKAHVWAGSIRETLQDVEFTVHTPTRELSVRLNLPGSFNVYNALAATAVGEIYKLSSEALTRGLGTLPAIPGRMEMVTAGVIVDFAHTPNALGQLLVFLRSKVKGRLIVVFGAAGERDRTKRPLMGAVAAKYADLIVLTREDNRAERVQDICEQIADGMSDKQRDKDYFIIPDRKEAIRFALTSAQSNDLVAITGKGHEQSLNIDGREIAWDDRKVVKELVSNKL